MEVSATLLMLDSARFSEVRNTWLLSLVRWYRLHACVTAVLTTGRLAKRVTNCSCCCCCSCSIMLLLYIYCNINIWIFIYYSISVLPLNIMHDFLNSNVIYIYRSYWYKVITKRVDWPTITYSKSINQYFQWFFTMMKLKFITIPLTMFKRKWL